MVQDLFLNETARELGTVFLPAASSFEKDGTFMNAERRVQRVRAAITPRGEARADWQIVCARRRGAWATRDGFAFASAARDLGRDPSGVAGGRRDLATTGSSTAACSGRVRPRIIPAPRGCTPTRSRGGRRRGCIRRGVPRRAPSSRDADYPLALITGRKLYQFNAGTMTGRTANVELQPGDVLEMSADDAARLGLARGEPRPACAAATARRRCRCAISAGVRDGELFATFHTAEVFLNRVTGPHRDRVTHTPEYKLTAVRVEKLEPQAR